MFSISDNGGSRQKPVSCQNHAHLQVQANLRPLAACHGVARARSDGKRTHGQEVGVHLEVHVLRLYGETLLQEH